MRHLTHFLFFVIIIAVGCKQEKLSLSISDLLINEKGWDTYEFKRSDIGLGGVFTGGNPYLIFNQYGSGCKFSSTGELFISYTFEGSEISEESSIKRTWEMVAKNEILVLSPNSDSIFVQVVELSASNFHLKYELKGDLYEYKLGPL
jgi:hypothetical protein